MEYLGTRQARSAAGVCVSPLPSATACGAAAVPPLRAAAGTAAATYVDSYPAPSPCRRSLTAASWRPSVYYSGSSAAAAAGDGNCPLSAENHFSAVGDSLTPSLFASNRNALYTRYTRADWKRNQAVEAATCETARRLADGLRLDAHRLARELEDRQRSTRQHVDQLLSCRLGDIQFWKGEINQEIDAVVRVVDDLGRARREVERFVADCEGQMRIAQECLYQREKRHSVDLVHDEAEVELVREVDDVGRARLALGGLLDRLAARSDLCRAAQHELEKDAAAKHAAAVVDSTALGTRESSRGVALRPGVERADACATVPETWAELADGLLGAARAQRAAARDLLADAQGELNGWSEQLRRRWDSASAALSRRSAETREARDAIQRRLAALLRDAADLERDAELLRRAADGQRDPMKVAHTRLEMRLHRPGTEACRDSAQHRLVQETHQLGEGLAALEARSHDLEGAQRRLLSARSALEQDLATKNYSLFIDQEKCLGMRRTYPVPQRVYRFL